jgi:hypothetical protein
MTFRLFHPPRYMYGLFSRKSASSCIPWMACERSVNPFLDTGKGDGHPRRVAQIHLLLGRSKDCRL